MSDRFSTLATGSSFRSLTTTAAIGPLDVAEAASTTSRMTALQLYFEVGSKQIMQMVLEEPPSVGSVIFEALKRPGLRTYDLAVDLLGRLTGETLSFALQVLPVNDFIPRPVYANRTWSIVISALGLAEDTYAEAATRYIERLLEDPNPIKRQAAFDALEVLQP